MKRHTVTLYVDDEHFGTWPHEFFIYLPRVGEKILFDRRPDGHERYVTVEEVSHDWTDNQTRIFGKEDNHGNG